MEDFVLECTRAVAATLFLIIFIIHGKHSILSKQNGWRLVLTGLTLLVFGSFMDITDEFLNFKEHFIVNGIDGAELLEEFVGYLCGLLLLVFGFAKWLPAMISHTKDIERYRTLHKRFRSISELTSDFAFICSVSKGGEIRGEWLSPSFKAITGYTLRDIPGFEAFYSITHPDDHNLLEKWQQDILDGKPSSFEIRIYSWDRKLIWLSVNAVPERASKRGPIVQLLGAASDITEAKIAQLALKTSANENKLLLREVHHRVKNNLQIIISLLEMAHTRIDDPSILCVCDDILAKVQSMALVHSQLYKSDTMGSIDIAEYTRSLYSTISKMHGNPPIIPIFELERIFLPLDQAIPFGLALNEIITNTFTHAFNGQNNKQIRMQTREDHGIVSITFSDNGCGLPQDILNAPKNTMGLRLLHSFICDHLCGSIHCETSIGTHYSINFPIDTENHSISANYAMH